MPKHPVENIRCIAFCGHGSAGKTTLLDRILTSTGTVNRNASVDDKTSICDFDEEEKTHKYTIESSVVHFDHAGKRFYAIDTPGYPDFIGQAIGAMRGVDTVAITINAQSGIEVNTRRVFSEAKKANLGKIIVINRLDGDNIDFPKLIANIQEVFGASCIPLNVPLGTGHDFKGVVSVLHPTDEAANAAIDPNDIRDSLIEAIIEVDEEVMSHYFDGNPPTDEEVAKMLPKAIAQGSITPILCVSAKTSKGLPELLDALALAAVPPDLIPRTAMKTTGDEEVEVKADPNGPLVAQVFKTRIDPFVQKLSFIRVFSGTLKKDALVPASGARKGLKIGTLFEMQASETAPIDEVGPGGIAAAAKVEELHTGSTLGEFRLPKIPFPTPMVGLAVSPKTRGDEGKLSGALGKICEEDSTFHRDLDPQTKEMVITGMSELHLQLLRERLKRRDKVEVDVHEPKIPYRETIQANAEGMYRHKKQSGGRGQFGEVHIRMFPFPKDETVESFVTKERFPSMKSTHLDEKNHFLWIDSIVGGSIPGNFMPAIEKGFKERLERGVLAGFKIQNVCIEVHFGKHHPVDSSEQAFKTAGSMAFRNVFQQAKPSLLEPIVKMEITVPTGNVGDINSDMSGRRGRVLSMDSAGGDMQTVIAVAPLSEVTTYSRSLSSITGGRGSYTLELSHYDVVPGNVVQEIIAKSQLKEEEEE